MSISDPLARQFYMQMCYYERWDTRTLDQKIDSQLYERTAISRRPEEVIKQTLSAEHIEYLMLDEESPIKVAQYYTQLPDKRILAEKLQRAIAIAREHCIEK